jgi:hypothetical protein
MDSIESTTVINISNFSIDSLRMTMKLCQNALRKDLFWIYNNINSNQTKKRLSENKNMYLKIYLNLSLLLNMFVKGIITHGNS